MHVSQIIDIESGSMKVLGVDIGSYSIKIAELDVGSKGFTFSNFHEIQLSPDSSRDRSLEIIERLREFSKMFPPGHARWVIGVPQHDVSVHFKRFPFRERAKILKSLAFELEDDIPFDIDETIFDFKIAELQGASADALTVACPRETIEKVLNTAKDGGFEAEIVSVEGLAYANIFERWNAPPTEANAATHVPSEATTIGQALPPPQRAQCLLHLGHSHSLLLVYRGAALIAVRSLFWGGSDVANSIASELSVAPFEALKILSSRGFILMNPAGATQAQIKLSQAISSPVDTLIREVKLTLLEISTTFNVAFDEVELLGGASQIQNLGAYLSQGLEMPTQVKANPLPNNPARFEITPHIAASAGVALGLAIEALKRPRNPAINLRKGEFERENVALKMFWETWRVPAQMLATAFAIFLVYSIVREEVVASLNETADEKVTEAAQKVAMLKGASATEEGVRRFIKTQKDKLKNHEAISQLDSYISAMDVLAKISSKLPPRAAAGQPGFDVTFFEVENSDVILKGHASSQAQIAQIERALGEIALPKSVAKVAAPEIKTGVPFGFKMKVNRRN